MITGVLNRLTFDDSAPIRFTLHVGSEQLPLNAQIGKGLEITYLGRADCIHCGTTVPSRYGGGYCYRCFTQLARCDLCVVSPTRCHYDEGTCREPEWGETFCMRPHWVYLVRSTDLKVGLTRQDNAVFRWTEQGARAGVVVARAETRRAAGAVEALIATRVSDKTDWRRLVTGQAVDLDLTVEAQRIKDEWAQPMRDLPDAQWTEGVVTELQYPVDRYLNRPQRIRLADQGTILGRVTGVIGQYVLFDHGAFNVAEHAGMHVQVTPVEHVRDNQMELF